MDRRCTQALQALRLPSPQHRSPHRARRRCTHTPAGLRGFTTGLLCRDRPLRGGSRPSGRQHDERPPCTATARDRRSDHPLCACGPRTHPQPTAHNMRAPAGSRCTARRGAAAGPRGLLRDGGGRGGGGPGVDPSRRSVSASKGRRGVSTCARELKGGADAAQAAHLASKSSSRRRYLRN